ncbi:MAG: IS1182 family transposase [Acidaminococcus sp.]|nr:IS1182 family transposase [Acidaminococcus sp.]
MQKNKPTQKDYTKIGSSYQLFLPLNFEVQIPNDDPVRLVRAMVEGMDVKALYDTYSHVENKLTSPIQLLEIVIYACMEGIRGSRKIEQSCKRDTHFMFLLDGKKAPDNATIARFCSLHLKPCIKELMIQMDKWLLARGFITLDSLFIDGTKIESVANKYKFVWKNRILGSQNKLIEKLEQLVPEIEERFGIKVCYGNTFHIRHLKKLLKKLLVIKRAEGIEFVHGCGKRKTILQKYYEILANYLKRLKVYTKQLHICGERNSFAKTDPDATFMRMKEDAMLNGTLKPGYNVQYANNSGFTLFADVSAHPTDMRTLIPFLEGFEAHFGQKFANIVADAGYESEENLVWLKKNQYTSYIKPNNYERSKRKKYKNDIGKAENMTYLPEQDMYICKGRRLLKVSKVTQVKNRSGYVSEKTYYECKDCSGCPYKEQCIHGNNCRTPMEKRNKKLVVSKNFAALRAESLKNITSEYGKELRMNRSIQAEGAFADLKDSLNVRRLETRGKGNALVTVGICAMARNVLKVHHKVQDGKEDLHLYPLKKEA